ncbi:MAG: HAD hydrolase family protein [Ignavibacteria bacterium]|jgi:3-deoxy-D-manno-octulosonate 8-phosphate phosphatase (KDO 8-P phosphatase)
MKNIKDIDFKKINFILLDLDGVLTDGSLLYTSGGDIIKVFNVYDGHGIVRGHENGMRFAIISGRGDAVNKIRAARLKVEELYENCDDKVAAYEEIKSKYNLTDENFCYIGDDVFDLPLLRKVAFSCAPATAMPEVKDEVDYVSPKGGGNGAVRDIIDLILRKNGK